MGEEDEEAVDIEDKDEAAVDIEDKEYVAGVGYAEDAKIEEEYIVGVEEYEEEAISFFNGIFFVYIGIHSNILPKSHVSHENIILSVLLSIS